MSSQDLQAIVAAWQAGALSKDTMFELFRKGEILPDGRTNQDEEQLIKADTKTEPVRPNTNSTRPLIDANPERNF
jgi:hypothetical protein